MTQAEQQGERQQHDVEEAFDRAYADWRMFAMRGYADWHPTSAAESDWSLLAWASGCSDLYKKLKG